MCQSSWEFHCELVQLQIIVIEFCTSWVRDNSPLGEERAFHDSSLPFELLLACSAVSSFVCSRSDASWKCCIYHAHSVYSVYSHLPTQLLLRLPRLLTLIFYTGVLILKCFPLLLLHTPPVSFKILDFLRPLLLEKLLTLMIMFCSQSLTRRTLSISSTTLT